MTEPPFEHFVMTRFNIRYNEHAPVATDEWLRSRLALFTRYTLPSMIGQTATFARWLVICDIQSPDWFKREIRALLPEPFEAVWLSGFFGPQAAADLVQARRDPDVRHLITTRIDNDDAIARDFLAIVQGEFRGQEFRFVNLTNGAQWDGTSMYSLSYRSNAFISLIEEVGVNGPRTVWLDEHGRLGQYGPVTELTTHPAWIQVLHGVNLGNRVEGVRCSPADVRPHFDVEMPVQELSRLRLATLQMADHARRVGRKAGSPYRRVRRTLSSGRRP
jgi:hypothetical protein